MSTWRYVQNGQPAAPVDMAALQALLTQGTLAPDTYVWKEGMANWIAAKNLPEFANCRPVAVPPVPAGTVVPPLPAPPKASPPSAVPVSEAEDVEKNRVFAAPNSKFAKFHANQGLVLFLASLVASVGCLVIGFIPFVNMVLVLVMPLLWIGWLVLVMLGIVNAAGGQCKPLPVIGHFELIK